MPTSKPRNTDDDTYTPLFKKQILEVVSTREVCHSCWWDATIQCGCPLTELALAHGFKPASRRYISGNEVLDFNQHNLGHSFNMQSNFIEAFDADFAQDTTLTSYEICERLFDAH